MGNELRKIVEADNVCLWCGRHRNEPEYLAPHHIVRKGAGGSDDPTNIVTLCLQCHNKVHMGIVGDIDILEIYRNSDLWRWTVVYERLKNK